MKAQFWSFDVIFAMVIFGVALTILAYVWYSINNQFSIAYGYGVGTMQAQLDNLASTLLTQGNPPNWYALVVANNTATWGNVSIGIGSSSNLSAQKIMTLASMANYNYQATKPLLGVGYDYYIVISGSGFSIPIGLNPSKNGAISVQVVNEKAILEGSPVTISISVWTNTSFGVS